MSRKTKRIISMCVALILIAGMAGLYFWQIQTGGNEEENVNLPPTTFIPLIQRTQNDVSRVVFYENGETSTLLPSTIDGMVVWTMLESAGYVFNPARVQDKARQSWALTAAEIAHEDASGLNLADFGLNPPLLTMEITYTDGSFTTLHLGGLTADMEHHFLMVDGNPTMYLVSEFVAGRMLFGPEDMVDTRLPEFHFTQAAFIGISQHGRQEIQLGLTSEGLVMLAPYEGMLLDVWRVSEFVINPLSGLQIGDLVEFRPDDLSHFGLDDPFLEFQFISIPEPGSRDAHLIFGNIFERDGVDFIYVKFADRPHVFETEFWQIGSLLNIHTFDIIQRMIALIDIRDVERVVIDSPGNYFELIPNHMENTLDIEPTINGILIQESDFRLAYRTIISLSADADIPPITPEGTPFATITFHQTENTELRFFDFDTNFFAVSVNGEDAWFVSNRRQVQLLFEFLHELVA